MSQAAHTNQSRIDWLIKSCLLGLLGCIGITFPLWIGIHREYPRLPIADFLEPISIVPIEIGLAVLFIGSVLFSIIKKESRLPLIIALASLAIFIVLDINRYQAWVHHFGWLLIASLFISKEKGQAIRVIQWMTAAVYIYSGVQKMTPHFSIEILPWLFGKWDSTNFLNSIPAGYAMAGFETLIGILLLIRPTRKIGVIFGAVLHLGIILLINGFHQWNYSILPWNLALIAILFLLFWKKDDDEKLSIKSLHPISWLLILLFILAPVLSFFNSWPDQCSFKLYSGNTTEAVISVDRSQYKCFPESARQVAIPGLDENTVQVNLDSWAFDHMNVPAFMSDRSYKRVAAPICDCLNNQGTLLIKKIDNWNPDNSRYIKYSCTEISDY